MIKTRDKKRFSLPRKTDCWRLFIDGRYEPYIPRALKLMGVDSVEAAQGQTHVMQLVTQNPTRKRARIIKLTSTRGTGGKLQWVHTPLKNLPKVREEAEFYFQKVVELSRKVKNKDTLNKAVDAIATIHWLYVHATPILRGTAGTTDVMTKVLFNALNIDVPRWKPGLAPDLEALVTPLEVYKKQYKNFFDGNLKFESLDVVA